MTIRHAEIAVSHKQKALKHTFPGVLKRFTKMKVVWRWAKIPLPSKYDTSIYQ